MMEYFGRVADIRRTSLNDHEIMTTGAGAEKGSAMEITAVKTKGLTGLTSTHAAGSIGDTAHAVEIDRKPMIDKEVGNITTVADHGLLHGRQSLAEMQSIASPLVGDPPQRHPRPHMRGLHT